MMDQISPSVRTPLRILPGNILKTINNQFTSLYANIHDTISSSNDFEAIKKDVWNDIASIYYRYDDNYQKRAFREVMLDITENIFNGKWDRIQNKLYRIEQKQ